MQHARTGICGEDQIPVALGVGRLIAPAWLAETLRVLLFHKGEQPRVRSAPGQEVTMQPILIGLQDDQPLVAHHDVEAALEVRRIFQVAVPVVEVCPEVGPARHGDLGMRRKQRKHQAGAAPLQAGDEDRSALHLHRLSAVFARCGKLAVILIGRSEASNPRCAYMSPNAAPSGDPCTELLMCWDVSCASLSRSNVIVPKAFLPSGVSSSWRRYVSQNSVEARRRCLVLAGLCSCRGPSLVKRSEIVLIRASRLQSP